MALVDRIVEQFNPKAGITRARQRVKLAQLRGAERALEARERVLSTAEAAIGELAAGAGSATAPARSETRWRGASRVLQSVSSWVTNLRPGSGDTPAPERERMAARAFDAFRNHLVGRAAGTRLRTNVVGTGLVCHPTPDAEALGLTEDQADALAAKIAPLFAQWTDDPRECDLEMSLDFGGQQGLALLTAALAGDVFALTPFEERVGCMFGLKVQLVDPGRVMNPNGTSNSETLQDGVQTTQTGAPLAIYIRNRHPGDDIQGAGANVFQRREILDPIFGRRRVMQVWGDKDRIGVTRGPSWLAPVLEPLQTIAQLTRCELLASVVNSMFTVFIKKESERLDADGQRLPAFAGQNPTKTDQGPSPSTTSLELGPAAVVDLNPGEEIQAADPKRPNAQFDPFFMAIVRQIGAALEIPVDELMLAYQSSYSAARAAMLQAWRMYTMRRWWLVTQFCQPIYELWFDEAVARGLIEVTDYSDPVRRRAYTRSLWIGPARGSMDENQEANAIRTRLDAGVSNEAIEIMQLHGESWQSVTRQRLREVKWREKNGLAVQARPGAAAPAGPAQPPNPNAPEPERPARPVTPESEEDE